MSSHVTVGAGRVESGARSFWGAKSTLCVVRAPQNPKSRLKAPLALPPSVPFRPRRRYAPGALAPAPTRHVGHVVADRARVGAVAQALVDHLAGAGAPRARPSPGTRSMTSITRWKRSRSLSIDHVERRRGRALLLVAAHVEVVVVGAPVGEAVDQPRVAVVGEDRPACRW